MSERDPNKPPFRKGDPRAREVGRRGGTVAKANRAALAAADPLTKGLLGDLLTYSTSDWMERLGLTGPSWESWRVVGKVLDGLPLSAEEMLTYTALTGRTTVPSDLRELLALAGRGSGKTSFMALQAIRSACRGYASVRGIPRVLLLAFVKDQAGISFEFVSEFFDKDRELRKLISSRTRTELMLAHGVRVQTIASNWRSVRGYSVAAALCDEIAMWWNENTNANEAVEIIRSLRPALGKVPGSRLLAATSPWTEEGFVFDMHQAHYGNDASKNILVVKAATRVLNPSFDAVTIAIAEEEDAESAASEYGAAWRVAGGTLLRPPAYDACVSKGVLERGPEELLLRIGLGEDPLGDDYFTAAVDLSGGTGQDSAALTIGHVEDDGGPEVFEQDLLVEVVPPFDPGVMVAEFAGHLARYGVTEVVGDQFSEGFAAAEFRRHGITYTVSARKTAECVLDSLAIINTHRCRLLENSKARRQWLNLKRDYASGGRPTILERGGKHHDDLAVVTARGIVAALGLGEEEVRRIAAVFG
jgi:hypothetical protein